MPCIVTALRSFTLHSTWPLATRFISFSYDAMYCNTFLCIAFSMSLDLYLSHTMPSHWNFLLRHTLLPPTLHLRFNQVSSPRSANWSSHQVVRTITITSKLLLTRTLLSWPLPSLSTWIGLVVCSCDRGGELRLPSRRNLLHRCNAFRLQGRSKHDHHLNPYNLLAPTGSLYVVTNSCLQHPLFCFFTQRNVTV